MLAPEDRLILRNLLRPDEGETLIHAVGTTFTLDLPSILGVTLAFTSDLLSDESDPIALLDAARRGGDKVDVFCQAGHFAPPSESTTLAAFLEPILHEVTPPRSGAIFHPKVWVAKYASEHGDRFRLLCGSRNLSQSNSWDVIVRLDGAQLDRRPRQANRPLSDFIRALPDFAVRTIDPQRRQRLAELAESLKTVEWETPNILGNVEPRFHALGLYDRRDDRTFVNELAGTQLLVVSPFLHDDAIALLTTASKHVRVVSRAESLDQLSPEVAATLSSTQILNPSAGLDHDTSGSTSEEENDRRNLLGDIHAKIYIAEYRRQARLFIGSANATSSGLLGRNVEFMVEIIGGSKQCGINALLGKSDADDEEGEDGFGSLLLDYEIRTTDDNASDERSAQELEAFLRKASLANFTSTVEDGPNGYRQVLESEESFLQDESISVSVGLLTQKESQFTVQEIPFTATFDGLRKTDITAFAVLTVRFGDDRSSIKRATLIKVDLVGEPKDRLDEIIASQFSEPGQFVRFLYLLLGVGSGKLNLTAMHNTAGPGWFATNAPGGIFEAIISALTSRPEVFAALDSTVSRLSATDEGRQILPPGFNNLWTHIKSAAQHLSEIDL